MRRFSAVLALTIFCLGASAQDSGLATRSSKYSVPETAAKLLAAIEASGLYKVFFQLDHGANAEKEGAARLAPSHLISFGNGNDAARCRGTSMNTTISAALTTSHNPDPGRVPAPLTTTIRRHNHTLIL